MFHIAYLQSIIINCLWNRVLVDLGTPITTSVIRIYVRYLPGPIRPVRAFGLFRRVSKCVGNTNLFNMKVRCSEVTVKTNKSSYKINKVEKVSTNFESVANNVKHDCLREHSSDAREKCLISTCLHHNSMLASFIVLFSYHKRTK